MEGALLTVLSTPTFNVIDKLVVNTLLSTIGSNIYNDAWILISTIWISYLILKSNKSWYKKISLPILIINIALYGISRFYQPYWKLTKFSSASILYYADSLAFLSILLVIKSFKSNRNFELNVKNQLLEDLPIATEQQDELGLHSYANHIFDTLNGAYFQQAFTIGINGKWGTGKTSLINLIRNKHIEKNHLFLEFSPWKYSNSSIQSKYFEELLDTLGSRKSELSSKIERYSKKINESNNGPVALFFNIVKELYRPSKNTEELLNDVKSEIINLNRQLFVVIDDLDRLRSDELFEVLKIIRSTANFPNTIYIIAYDRSFIDKSLESVNSNSANEYLDKIVNLELVLPGTHSSILPKILLKELTKNLDEYNTTVLKEAITGTFSESSSLIKNSLQSIRHVKRVVNSFLINTKNLIGEVNVADFLLLELIRSKYPTVYTVFQKKYIDYLEVKEMGNQIIGRYQLKVVNDTEHFRQNDLEKFSTYLFELDWIRSNKSVSHSDVIWVRQAFELLFPISAAGKGDDSICFTNRTERYLAYELQATDISNAEFEATMKLDITQIKEKINTWIIEGKEFSVKHMFIRIKTSKELDENLKIIEAIFHLASQKSRFNGYYFDNLIWYDFDDLVSKIHSTHAQISKKNALLRRKFEKQVAKFLINRETYAIYSSSFINHNLNRSEHFLPLRTDVLKRINLYHLHQHIEHFPRLDNLTWFYFNNCKTKVWTRINDTYCTSTTSEYLPESINIFKKLIIERELDTYIKEILRRDFFDKELFNLSDSFLKVFGSLDNFSAEIKYATNSSFKEEFIDFLDHVKANNQKLTLAYTFKIIPI